MEILSVGVVVDFCTFILQLLPIFDWMVCV